MVARPRAARDPPARSRRRSSPPPRRRVANASCRTGTASAPPRSGIEPLDDAARDLEAVRVVEADEAVRRVEDRRERAVVPAQHDGPRAAVALAELEDVADRGAPEVVDRLVVVADDRHVAVPLGEQRDELRLGAVGVLELVDQDVPEPRLDVLARRRRLADEPQGKCDLVAEVDRAVLAQERLVAGVGAGELRLAPRHLAARRRRRIRVRLRRRPRRPSAASRAACAAYASGETSSSCARANSGASAPRNWVGSPSGRYASSPSSKRRSRRKTTVSARDRTRTSGGRPSSNANSRIRRSPNAWKVEIAVSV